VPSIALILTLVLVTSAIFVTMVLRIGERSAQDDVASSARLVGLMALSERLRDRPIDVRACWQRSPRHVELDLGGHDVLILDLFWDRERIPVKVRDLRWWDDVGWVMDAELADGSTQPFYAWRCRLVALDMIGV
jgi:hypothetical protein